MDDADSSATTKTDCIGDFDCDGKPAPWATDGATASRMAFATVTATKLDALGVCGGDCAADADADGICDDVDDCVDRLTLAAFATVLERFTIADVRHSCWRLRL